MEVEKEAGLANCTKAFRALSWIERHPLTILRNHFFGDLDPNNESHFEIFNARWIKDNIFRGDAVERSMTQQMAQLSDQAEHFLEDRENLLFRPNTKEDFETVLADHPLCPANDLRAFISALLQECCPPKPLTHVHYLPYV